MTLAREAFANSMGRAAATNVGRATKDSVQVPSEERYTKLLAESFCVAVVGDNCYVLQNMYEDSEVIPYGCVFEDWVAACERLLAKNVSKAMMDPEEEPEEEQE